MALVAAQELASGALGRRELRIVVDGGGRGAGGGRVELDDEVPVGDDRSVGILDYEDARPLAGRAPRARRTRAILPLEVEPSARACDTDARRLGSETKHEDLADLDVGDRARERVRLIVGVLGAVAERERLRALARRVRAERNVAVDVLAARVGERLAVVEVQRPVGGRARHVDGDDERDRVLPRQRCSAADEVATSENVPAAVQDRDRLERGRHLDVGAAVRGAKVDLVGEVMIVRLRRAGISVTVGAGKASSRANLVVRDVDLLSCHALLDDGLDEQARAAEVELVVERETLCVVREDDILRPGSGGASVSSSSGTRQREQRGAYLRMGRPARECS